MLTSPLLLFLPVSLRGPGAASVLWAGSPALSPPCPLSFIAAPALCSLNAESAGSGPSRSSPWSSRAGPAYGLLAPRLSLREELHAGAC